MKEGLLKAGWIIIGIVTVLCLFYAITAEPNYERMYETEKTHREIQDKKIDSLESLTERLDCENEAYKKKQHQMETQIIIIRTEYEKNSQRFNLPSLDELLRSSN